MNSGPNNFFKGKDMEFNLKKMSTEEKMRAMELLWDDLCARQPDFNSPDWHEAILKERETRLQEGKEKLIDWEQAKKEIRELSL